MGGFFGGGGGLILVFGLRLSHIMLMYDREERNC